MSVNETTTEFDPQSVVPPACNVIDGEWRPASAGDAIDVIDPGTGDTIGAIAASSAADVDTAVDAARQSFEDQRWSGLSGAQRGAIMWEISRIIEKNADSLARLESLDVGMPVTQAKLMVGEAANHFRYFAGWADKIDGRSVEVGPEAARFQAYTLREPVGVVGAILPWNAPLIASGMKLAPALATGCSLVVKPSEEASLSPLALAMLMLEAGLPPGVVNVVTGLGPTVGSAIAGHPDIDKVSFTGSSENGRKIIAAAQGNLKKVSLELGGKSPTLVFADADIEQAVDGISVGIFWNSGQICTASTRLLVHRDVVDEVVEGVAEKARALNVGYCTDPGADIGPLVSQRQLDRVSSYVESGRDSGARVVTGGSRIGDRGFYYAPTVLAETTSQMKVVREEIFGPVIVAMAFDDTDEAVRMANDTEYGLAASVWSRDVSRAHRVARRLRAGRVGINVHRAGGVQLPVGGYKQSGWGRECGPEALEEFLETKAVVSKLDI